MQFPPELCAEIQARMERAVTSHPGALSADRKALLVTGSIGYGCYVSPDGDVFMETYDVGSDEPSTFDRSYRAQVACLKLGSRSLPQLADLMPSRPSDGTDLSNLQRFRLVAPGTVCRTVRGRRCALS